MCLNFFVIRNLKDAMGNQSSAAFLSGVKLVIYPAISQGHQTQASEHRVRLLQAIYTACHFFTSLIKINGHVDALQERTTKSRL